MLNCTAMLEFLFTFSELIIEYSEAIKTLCCSEIILKPIKKIITKGCYMSNTNAFRQVYKIMSS